MRSESILRRMKTHKVLPRCFKPFFWDVDFDKLSIRKSRRFIIARLMEHGDDVAVRFLLKTYSQEEMAAVVRQSRSLSQRSRNFWKVLLDLEHEECILRSYPNPFGNY